MERIDMDEEMKRLESVQFKPFTSMFRDRIEISAQESEKTLFWDLTLFLEMIVKCITIGMVISLHEDRHNQRYSLLHALVREGSIGGWLRILHNSVSGPPSHNLRNELFKERMELTQKFKSGNWNYDCAKLINESARTVNDRIQQISTKANLLQGLDDVAALRNKTIGHGAPRSSTCETVNPLMIRAIRLCGSSFSLFHRPWAYLKQNLAHNYRVTRICGEMDGSFEHLKYIDGDEGIKLRNGVYLYLEEENIEIRIDLIKSDPDLVDFFFPNGDFNGETYEAISYISGNTYRQDATPYLSPAGARPESETRGMGELMNIVGSTFTNLPARPDQYVMRENLESETYEKLTNLKRYPIVTLYGRGGIGKTSLALSTLYQIAEADIYDAIVWFSARDIDLRPEGIRLVKPDIRSQEDIANEFVKVLPPEENISSSEEELEYLGRCLKEPPETSPAGLEKPILFAFDNFETVQDPVDLYNWVDNWILPPNKVLITVRPAEFNADYQIHVKGMEREEAFELMRNTASRLGIAGKYDEETIFRESEGHPYIIKILLGELAKSGTNRAPEPIIAQKDDILEALFARTYSNLSTAAQRVFLLLCSWKASVPQFALEAVVMSKRDTAADERIDVERAIRELWQTSLIESMRSDVDNHMFVSVPLVVRKFGENQLRVSPIRSAVEADREFLMLFGVAKPSDDLSQGVQPRINNLLRSIARSVSRGGSLHDYRSILEYVGHSYTPAWLDIVQLIRECGSNDDLEWAKEALEAYIVEADDSSRENVLAAWDMMARICRLSGDVMGEMNAILGSTEMKPDLDVISANANRLNNILRQHPTIDSDEKRVLVRRMANVFEEKLSKVEPDDADTYSRAGWLYLHLGDEEKARHMVSQGYSLDPGNPHIQNLASKVGLADK